ncbi:hypothetical protein THRCLA_03761 [Thraustotheca clavata]|uniref:DUF4419 domain-containing protein n=1 Tax=Thraustotheca clavata TaxID=74557 RepID=A0A1W0A1N9_9STRA|nr:hypothetical protein THRCLA_03761 [Thraustotheca clavata]
MVTFPVSAKQTEKYDNAFVNVPLVVSQKEFQQEGCGTIVQSSPSKGKFGRTDSGFVKGIIEAYNHHHNLVLRPDDVWLAIMIQFGLYVNGNAENLRHIFVNHEGQRELKVIRKGSLFTVDFGSMAVKMVNLMNANLVDSTLGQWILPSFTTTTHHDTIVGSVVMMASMKKYFKYVFELECGIPEVTLLGTVEDWENIRQRIEKLQDYGEVMHEWVEMLESILDEFILAAKNKPNVEFWRRVCHDISNGSGPTYISGWVSAFCVFNEDGKWQGSKKCVDMGGYDFNSDYPIIDTNDIPPGYLTVDVLVIDNGVKHKSMMFAGHLAYEVRDETTIVPHLSWSIVLKDGTPKPKPKYSYEQELPSEPEDCDLCGLFD